MAHYRTIQSALSEEQHYKLEQWLLTNQIKLTNRTRREFSDVVPVAKIFKKIHNRLVDMRNYFSKSSFPLKLQNWEAFNFNVMRKLGLQISQPMLVSLAIGAEGAIDPLFHELMKSQENPGRYRTHATLRSRSQPPAVKKELVMEPVKKEPLIVIEEAFKELKDSAEAFTLDVSVIVNGQLTKTPRKLVFYENFLKLQQQCNEKDNFITSLTQEALNLERTLREKEDRISELLDNLSRLSFGIMSKRHSVDDM